MTATDEGCVCEDAESCESCGWDALALIDDAADEDRVFTKEDAGRSIRNKALWLAEDRQEPRTAGSLNHADLGREVAVTARVLFGPGYSQPFMEVEVARGPSVLIPLPADTPVHVHDEEAGRG